MGWELFFSTGSLHDVVAKGSDSGVKSPPCLFQAVCPWAYEEPSLSPVALFCRMGIKRVPKFGGACSLYNFGGSNL